MMHFFNNIRNRAAYIKGNLFANDQNSDEQLQIEISLNSKYDGFNQSRDIEFLEFPARAHLEDNNRTMFAPIHIVTSQIKINNLKVRLMRIKNFWEKENRYCYINMTLDTLIDAEHEPKHLDDQEYLMKNPFKNSVLLNAEEAKLLQVRLLLESAEEESNCFPNRIQVDLKSRNIAKTQTKTVYFTMVLIFILMVSMATCIRQLKRILTNY
jgi:hypothetical protein